MRRSENGANSGRAEYLDRGVHAVALTDKSNIHQNQRRLFLSGISDGFVRGIGGCDDVKTCIAQLCLDLHRDEEVILNDEDAGLRRVLHLVLRLSDTPPVTAR